MNTPRLTVMCPCCEAKLIIDQQTGSIISHEEKTKPLASFEEMQKDLDKQKATRNQLFAQELNSVKDRGRLLEEKFQEALKRHEKDEDKGKPFSNPLDVE